MGSKDVFEALDLVSDLNGGAMAVEYILRMKHLDNTKKLKPNLKALLLRAKRAIVAIRTSNLQVPEETLIVVPPTWDYEAEKAIKTLELLVEGYKSGVADLDQLQDFLNETSSLGLNVADTLKEDYIGRRGFNPI